MLFILLTPVLILLLALLLHYCQHFKIEIHTRRKLTLRTSSMNISKDKLQRECKLPQCCHCCVSLRPKDGETYNFFPTSFLYIVIAKIIISVFIISLDVMRYDEDHQYTHHNIFGSHSPQTYHHKQSILSFQSVRGSNAEEIFIIVSDYVLIYSVMLFLLWESLFSFFKYYTTYNIVRNIKTASTHSVVMRFMPYAVVFALLFIVQVHIYYYLWPILLLLHIVFNCMCVTKFSSMLISRYQLFIGIDERVDTNDNANVLRNVYTMRRISVICSFLQTAALALFLISYNVHIIYYLPLLWCISTSIYSLNFVRNRRYLRWKLFECNQKIKYHPSVFARNENSRNKEAKRASKTLSSKKEATEAHPAPITIDITSTKFSEIGVDDGHKSESVKSVADTASTTISNEHSASGPHVTFAGEIKTTGYDADSSASRRTVSRSKAFQILGIQTGSVRRLRPELRAIVKSQSDIISSPTSDVPIAAIKITCSKSDITPQNHVEAIRKSTYTESRNEDEPNQEESELSRTYFPQIPLRRVSIASPATAANPFEFNVNAINAKHCDLDAIEYIGDEGSEDEDDDDCVFVDFVDYNHHGIEVNADVHTVDVYGLKPHKQTPLQLKHQKSNSDPVVINDILNNMNIAQVMDSLDLFAKYGFCSRNSINSLYQLTKYRNKLQQINN